MTISLAYKKTNISHIILLFILVMYCSSLAAQDESSDNETATSESEIPTIVNETITYLNKDGTLRFSEAENEQLSVSLSNTSSSSLVHASDTGFSFNEYDELMRIIKQTVWKYPNNSTEQSNSEPYVYSVTTYFYKDDKIEPDLEESEYPVDKKKKTIQYSENGLAIKQVTYKANKDKIEPENYEIIETVSNKYDTKKRLVEQIITKVIDESNDMTKLSVYTYTEGIDKPNCDYYENGMLKMSLVRQDNSVYVQTVYFTDKTSVETKYSSDVKVAEVFLLNGKVLRRKSYEN